VQDNCIKKASSAGLKINQEGGAKALSLGVKQAATCLAEEIFNTSTAFFFITKILSCQ
jgi:hypothetical protein